MQKTKVRDRAIRSKTEEAPASDRTAKKLIKAAKTTGVAKVVPTLTENEVEILIRFGLDRKKDKNLAEGDIKAVQEILLEKAKLQQAKKLYDKEMTMSAVVSSRDSRTVYPDKVYKWLKKKFAPKTAEEWDAFWLIFNEVFKVQTTQFKDKFGAETLDKLSTIETEEYANVALKDKA